MDSTVRTTACITALLWLTAAAFAQKATLEFHAAGPRDIWVSDELPTAPPPDPRETEENSHILDLTGSRPDDWVIVRDRNTGNLAARRVKEVGSSWKLGADDYRFVGSVVIRLVHEGRPVAAGAVTLRDGRRTMQQVLDASARGEAEFFAVQPGEVRIEVAYRAEGRTPTPIRQTVDIPLRRDEAQYLHVVTITAAVDTIEAGSAAAGEEGAAGPVREVQPPSQQPPPRPEGGILGRVVLFLITLAIAAGIIYFVLRWLKNNPDTAKSTFDNLGIKIPQSQDPASPTLDPAAPAPVVMPQPPQQIILDDAAPPTPVAAAAPVVSQLSVEPKLIRDTGQVFNLHEGPNLVGRQDGIPVPLPDENSVSRQHAELVRSGSQLIVRDLGSTNGTFVNGAKVEGEQALRPGDSVQFGAVRFRYEG
jgi:hypothetical protein